MRPLKDSERLASSYMYGEKKDIVQRQQIKQKNCIKKPGSTGFSKTDSSDKPHMCGNKKHIFNLHIVLGNLFIFFLSAGKPPGIVWDIVELLLEPQSAEARRHLQARNSSTCYRVILHQLQHVFLLSNLLQY